MSWVRQLANRLTGRASDADVRALSLSTVLYNQQGWQYRKVQSHELREGDYEVVSVSIDCAPQGLPGLWYALDGPGGQTEQAFLVPVTYMRKGALRQFDMRGPGGEALPVIGRSEYTALMSGLLTYQLEDSPTPGTEAALLEAALETILDGDPEAAVAASRELLTNGTVGGRPVLDPSRVNKWARELLTDLAKVWVLFALVPGEYAGRRVVLKYSHHAKQSADDASARRRWLGAAGLSTLPVKFTLSHPTGAASHHLEVTVPGDLSCSSLRMPGPVEDRNTTDSSDAGVVHGAASYEVEPDKPAFVEFTVPWAGMRATTWLVSSVTFAVTFLGLLLPGAQQALLDAADGAGAVLLAVPAVAVAFAAGRRESEVESVLLGPLRVWVTTCALSLFACACSIVGVLHDPFRTWLWAIGALASMTVALVLCAREARLILGRWWEPLVGLTAAFVLFTVELRVGDTWPRAWSEQLVAWSWVLCRWLVP
ncbi:hypothetical protein L2K70_11135 [Nocardioides KLBMP 9356]|uniref:Uncharacterized protein n=1 Tax=Nocardioides potassii TaxID=2911371 RepID=A0ABS9HDG1_9ACTN|nr:hypothetical protein [Nocardioides potassii]MCF6378156.1 hypothetical protein [Nocardioides potassii]